MLSILTGLAIAVIFSFVAHGIYGLEGVMTLQWIDQVFWVIIGAGFVIGAINTLWQCIPCKMGKMAHSKTFINIFCGSCKH